MYSVGPAEFDRVHYYQLINKLTREFSINQLYNFSATFDVFCKYERISLYHRSAFGVMLTGIARSSVLMHKNSPDTHIIVMQTILINHHVIVCPNV